MLVNDPHINCLVHPDASTSLDVTDSFNVLKTTFPLLPLQSQNVARSHHHVGISSWSRPAASRHLYKDHVTHFATVKTWSRNRIASPDRNSQPQNRSCWWWICRNIALASIVAERQLQTRRHCHHRPCPMAPLSTWLDPSGRWAQKEGGSPPTNGRFDASKFQVLQHICQ